MEEKIQKIRSACIKANPQYFSYYVANTGKFEFNGHWEIADTVEDIPIRLRDIEDPLNGIRRHWSEERPVRFSDILLALQKVKMADRIMLDVEGRFYNDEMSLLDENAKWDYLKDNLLFQSQETVDFIFKILGLWTTTQFLK